MIVGDVIYGVESRSRFVLKPLDDSLLVTCGYNPADVLSCSIVGSSGEISAEDLPHLPLVDYELILTRFYICSFGDAINQNMECKNCLKKFSITFSLASWVSDVCNSIPAESPHVFDNTRFSLPTQALLSTIEPKVNTLAEKLWCSDTALPAERLGEFESYVASVCPILTDHIESDCPHCGEFCSKEFVLKTHLLNKLKSQLNVLLTDIHLLATKYHWSLRDILDLPRQTRKTLAGMIRHQTQPSSAAPGRTL